MDSRRDFFRNLAGAAVALFPFVSLKKISVVPAPPAPVDPVWLTGLPSTDAGLPWRD